MTTYARNIGGVAVDVTTSDPHSSFHPQIASQFVAVPDGTQNGATLSNSVWTNPAPVAAPAPMRPPLAPMAFYSAFTPLERIAIKTSTDEIVQEFWDTYQRAERTGTPINPNDASVVEGLAYLAGTPLAGRTIAQPILASPARIAQIQAGLAQ